MSTIGPIKQYELIDCATNNYACLKYCEIRVLAKNRSAT